MCCGAWRNRSSIESARYTKGSGSPALLLPCGGSILMHDCAPCMCLAGLGSRCPQGPPGSSPTGGNTCIGLESCRLPSSIGLVCIGACLVLFRLTPPPPTKNKSALGPDGFDTLVVVPSRPVPQGVVGAVFGSHRSQMCDVVCISRTPGHGRAAAHASVSQRPGFGVGQRSVRSWPCRV